ncbi:MAG: MFS transporter [Hyphomicrobiales bacterium]
MQYTLSQTSWPRAFTFFLAGVAVAFLVGKASSTLPLLRADLGLSLFQAGLVVSIFNLIAGCMGVLFGAFADKFGHARVAVTGLLTAALGSFAGAYAETPVLLLSSRVVEGLGFFLATVSVPPLLLRVSAQADRQKVMGLWGAYMPTGTAIMMLAGGILAVSIGWRGIWMLSGILIVFVAGLVWMAARVGAPKAKPRGASVVTRASLLQVTRHKGSLLLALIFGAYAGQYLSITAFIPLILVENGGWSLAAAGTAGAGIIAVNIIGNLFSGVVLDAGFSRKAAIIVATLAMMIGAFLVMNDAFPIWVRIAGGVLFSGVGGLIPGALFSGVAYHAPSPGLISTVNGLMMQGSSFGQVALPFMVSALVSALGFWESALFITMPAACAVIWAAISLGKLETNTASGQ